MAIPSKGTATGMLLRSFEGRRSRGALLKGMLATGLAAAGAGLVPSLAHADDPENDAEDSIQQIFTIARNAERLAVTLYTNGVANAQAMGITEPDEVDFLKAALIEEQIHEYFFAANGGQVLFNTFSFPDGPATFTDLQKFVTAQQQLEGFFDSAFIAAVEEFAMMGQPTLARIACQIAMVESEHRVLGRDLGDLYIVSNWAYAPKLVESVGDAPAALQSAGYLSPVSGNSFAYQQASFTSPDLNKVFNQIMYHNGPFAAPEDGED
jgi:hypothetical protein